MSIALILSIIVQVGLVVHIVKTGRNMTWVFIVLFFPLIGTLAYVIIELLPEFRNSRAAQTAGRSLERAVNPGKDLDAAAQRFAVTETVQNATALAEEYLARSRFTEARDLYQRFLKGLHADDPRLLTGMARAQFGLADYAGTVASLDRLRAAHPDQRSPEAHLLYARAVEESGQVDEAVHEYEALCGYYPGPEPFCRLGLILKARGQADRARPLFEKVATESRVAGPHYNRIHKEWVAIARRESSG